MNSLSYDQRTKRIFDFLYSGENALLRRYKVPEHMSDEALRAEVNEMVEDINRDIPEGQTSAHFDALIPELRQAIRRRHGAQTWPSAKVLMAATKDAVDECQRRGGAGQGGAEGAILTAMADWYRKFGSVLPGCGKTSRTAALIQRGVFTAREARHAGFPLTAADEAAAKSEPMTAAEAKTHVEATARLRDISIDEARVQIADEQNIPMHLLEADLSNAGRGIDRKAKEIKRQKGLF